MQRFLSTLLRFLPVLGLLVLLPMQPASAEQQRLVVLGDSISAAYGMSLEQGWVSLLQDELQRRGLDVAVINASISGETTGGGLRRLPALLAKHQPTLLVIELGGNDGLRGQPIKSLRANLRAMAGNAIAGGAEVLLLPMEIPPNYGSRYTSDFRDSFPRIATETGARLGAFILDGIATDPALMQADGIHPVAEAQPAMLANVLPDILAALQ